MEKINLTQKELAYLMAEMGAEELFGVPDPCHGMSTEELQNEHIFLQAELERKNLLEMDFTGVCSLREDAERMISVCAFCNAYVMGELHGVKQEKRFTAYFNGEQWALLELEEDSAQLSLCQPEDILELIRAELTEDVGRPRDGKGQLRFSGKLLEQAAELFRRDREREAEAILREGGLTDEAAELILSGFSGEGRSFTLAGVNFKKNEVRSLFSIVKEKQVLCMEQGGSGWESGEWSVELCGSMVYCRKVQSLLEEMEVSIQ